MKKLAIVTTHPIQYNAPFFQRLAQLEGLEIRVFYTWGEAALKKYDPGFSKTVEWNIPLLEGYASAFVRNVAKRPGSHHFNGIDNPTLVREIADWKAHAVLVYGWPFKSHVQVFRAFHGKIPVWFRGDSTLIDRQPPFRAWLRTSWLRWVYRHVDIAFYPGTRNEAYFLHHGLQKKQLVFMPHAIDNERFAQASRLSEEQKAAWKMANGIGSDELIFLYAGKLTANKNVGLLVEAFLEAELAGTRLLIVGNGAEEILLKEKAAGSRKISFLPFQNQAEMPALYAMADLVVLPSKKGETWGLVINEAMACGKPVLTSDACGAAADLVRPGWNGEIFRNNQKKDLIRQLRVLAGTPTVLAQMGNNAASLIKVWNYEAGCRAISRVLAQNNQPAERN